MGSVRPSVGTVQVGEINLTGNWAHWRDRIAVVPQDYFILNASIAENVAFGRLAEEINVEKVISSLAAVRLADWFAQQKNGIWNHVGENGKLMNGGQRQRLALARALYFDKDIWILDECTSALDLHTEALILETIARFKGQVTVIMAAHRQLFSAVQTSWSALKTESCRLKATWQRWLPSNQKLLSFCIWTCHRTTNNWAAASKGIHDT